MEALVLMSVLKGESTLEQLVPSSVLWMQDILRKLYETEKTE